jgi:hypothetical protein
MATIFPARVAEQNWEKQARSCIRHLLENVLQRPAPAADGLHCDTAAEQQPGPLRVKRRCILHPDEEHSFRRIKIEAEQDARVKQMARQFLRLVALDG